MNKFKQGLKTVFMAAAVGVVVAPPVLLVSAAVYNGAGYLVNEINDQIADRHIPQPPYEPRP